MKLAGRVGVWIEQLSILRDFGWRSLAGLDRIALGRRGERIAERHLKRRGYRILERNFRGAGAEIDLVAMDGETLVFVEVKTRRTVLAGTPQEAVNWHKQRHLRRAGEIYARRHRMDGRPIRFDVVAIQEDGSGRHLELLRDAF
ncbi:MAG TPA: YraN family protein [Candidatus Binataceae bacterium]